MSDEVDELEARMLSTFAEVKRTVDNTNSSESRGALRRIIHRYANALMTGGKLLFMGNGGSAADAQHIAAEYVVRLRGARQALAAIALTVDSSVLTAAGNDLGFETVFSRQVAALAKPNDVVVMHSTSGNSQNLVKVAEYCRVYGIPTVALLGKDGGELGKLVSEALIVPSDDTAHIQEMHLAMQHLICAEVERIVC